MLYKIKKLYLKKEKSKERNKKSTNGIVLKNINMRSIFVIREELDVKQKWYENICMSIRMI